MIILIGGTKGGSSKTITAVNLAIAIAQKNAKDADEVFLLDADAQGSATNWMGRRMSLMIQPEIKYAKRNSKEAVGVLASNLKALDERYKYVIVDAGGYDGPGFREALSVCNLFVCPLQPTQMDLDTAEETMELIGLTKIYNPTLKSMVVLTRCSTTINSKDESDAREMLEGIGFKVARSITRNRVSYQRCVSEGTGITESTDEKASHEFQLLTKEILNGLAT